MNKYFVIGITFILILIFGIGCAGACKSDNTISGTVFVSGNEPFTYLALKSEADKYYKIECSDSLKKELWSMQTKIVKLKYSDIIESDKQGVLTVSQIITEE